ncbi:MAG: hypothetical protein VB958_05770 [Thalassolituus sp.]|jgi:hypothetical protein|uniref:hypothetical protein n=1 Tax=Thalassolituus sp. TaxID=2030822 RepID=UPI003981C88E
MEDLDNDWRMEDVHFVSEDTRLSTGQIALKGSQVTRLSIAKVNRKKSIRILLPNSTALFLSASRRAWIEAQEIRKGSRIDRSIKKEVTFTTTQDSFDYLERVMESVIMAHSAIESFANENIPVDFVYHKHRRSDSVLEAMSSKDIERHLSLSEKLSLVLPECLSVDSPKGSKCWQGFVELKSVRDSLIHMKKDDRRSSGPEIPTVWHDLLVQEPPYRLAKDVCEYFIKNMDKAEPRWYSEYPSK